MRTSPDGTASCITVELVGCGGRGISHPHTHTTSAPTDGLLLALFLAPMNTSISSDCRLCKCTKLNFKKKEAHCGHTRFPYCIT